uniref:Protein PIN-LIKES 7-like n=1 Tax=Nelumbo nucifera TaxID=4432 RepID=A0A822ZNZ3_NELNU|nr:TPA_asm: hypothetical protein HUJ06_016460 [Nelumbo nucifera]
MGFWTLFQVASMPVLQVLLISILGAFMATNYCNLLNADARRHMNKIVFITFTPSLMFACLAKTVTFQDIISWWFMPVNIGLTFLIGGILGWILVKILKPEPYLEGLVIATCSAGNLGNLLLIVVPAICNEDGSPFGDHNVCGSVGLSYASMSMALGGFFIWSYTYHLIRTSGIKYRALQAAQSIPKVPNTDPDATGETHLLKTDDQEKAVVVLVPPAKPVDEDTENKVVIAIERAGEGKMALWGKVEETLHQILEELMTPPTIAAILGFIFGATPWLKNLLIGESAPLRVIQDSIKLLGDGTIPCITLILGGNLTQVIAAGKLGLLPSDPLFGYVLMVQFTLPPAMNIGTMTQLFDVGQEECSVLYLWTYLVAALALTVWSTVYMWILT